MARHGPPLGTRRRGFHQTYSCWKEDHQIERFSGTITMGCAEGVKKNQEHGGVRASKPSNCLGKQTSSKWVVGPDMETKNRKKSLKCFRPGTKGSPPKPGRGQGEAREKKYARPPQKTASKNSVGGKPKKKGVSEEARARAMVSPRTNRKRDETDRQGKTARGQRPSE